MNDDETECQGHREGNPFRESNPEHNFAVLWDKLDMIQDGIGDVKMQVVENKTDIKWLKLSYKGQMVLTGGTFLTILALLYTIFSGLV